MSYRVVYVIQSGSKAGAYERMCAGKKMQATMDVLDPKTHHDTLAIAVLTRNMNFPDGVIQKVLLTAAVQTVDCERREAGIV